MAAAQSGAPSDVDDVIRRHGRTMWNATATQRNQLLHGGRSSKCPYPDGARTDRSLCAPCTELWHDVALIVAPKLLRARTRRVHDIDAYVATTARNALRDARDRRDAEQGLLVRPATRLPGRAWVARLCHDEQDQTLLIRMLLALREPQVDGLEVLPVQRWADQHGVTVGEMRSRVDALLARWETLEPARFAANITGPISERLNGHLLRGEAFEAGLDRDGDPWATAAAMVA